MRGGGKQERIGRRQYEQGEEVRSFTSHVASKRETSSESVRKFQDGMQSFRSHAEEARTALTTREVSQEDMHRYSTSPAGGAGGSSIKEDETFVPVGSRLASVQRSPSMPPRLRSLRRTRTRVRALVVRLLAGVLPKNLQQDC